MAQKKKLRINMIGGSAYSSTGGIQAMNRLILKELRLVGLLRRGFFLWDNFELATEEGRLLSTEGVAGLYCLDRRRFITDLVRQAVLHPNDLWFCTHINYATLAFALSRVRSRRVGILLHAAELDEDFSVLKRAALRHAGWIVAVSEFTKKKAIGLGANPSRVHVILNGIEDPCPNFAPRLGARARPSILFVGRMDERYKGQTELLDAVTLLRDRVPGLIVSFLGGGRTLDDWKAEAVRRGITTAAEFKGTVSGEDLSRAYDGAAVFAMPSENEGFGLVYAEAMAHGVPCVGSDRDAAREVIADGETGFCVPARNSTALADAIYRIITSSSLQSNMGLAGRKRFLRNFTAILYRERLLTSMGNWQTSVCS